MCGIFGSIGLELNREVVSECLKRIKHRGPDGSDIWNERDVWLGHCRLSILDLSEKATQPMTYLNGRYTITYNGEVYNFVELKNELEQIGYEFRTLSDTEVILAAYDCWGADCLKKLNGMWAFAIWDAVEQSLFLSRDRFGIKPLFYAEIDGGIAFASEMKALIPVMKDVKMHDSLIEEIIRSGVMQYETGAESLIKGIKRFPAACYAYYEKGKMNCVKWWNTLDEMPDIPSEYSDQVEMFRELFLDACKIRMRSDVTIGTALSGGLDSSATICSMRHITSCSTERDARVNRDCNHAYVAAFPGTTLDESKYAKAVTDYLGIDATFVDINPKYCINDLEDDLFLFEEIYTTSPVPMMTTYGAMRQDGTYVTIDGHGADELFGGYAMDLPYAFPDAGWNKKDVDMILRTCASCFPNDGSNYSVKSVNKDYKLFFSYVLKNYIKKFNKKSGYNTFWSQYPLVDSFGRHLYERSHIDILPTLLRNYDRYSMANGVEIRMPFMDYRIVAFSLALPWSSKIRNGYTKSIVRDALESIMPTEVVRRKVKIGFNTPFVEWMQGEMKEYFLDLVSSRDYNEYGYLAGESVKRDIIRICSAKESVTYFEAEDAWRRLSPYLWKKCFFDRLSSAV